MRLGFRDIIFLGLILIIVALGVYMVNYVHSESYKCMNQPLIYGAAHLHTSNNAPITCSCSAPGNPALLSFNKDNMTFSDAISFSSINISDMHA